MLAEKVSPSGLASDHLETSQEKKTKCTLIKLTCWLSSKFCVTLGTLTQAFGQDSTAVLRVDNPVVVFERVHDLQHCADPPNRVVDGHCAYELCC